MKTVLLIAALVLLGQSSSAQQTIDGYELRFYTAAGGATPVGTTSAPAAAIFCNQTMPTTPVLTNPSFLFWVDTANAGKACRWALASIITGLAPGTYTVRLLAISSGMVSTESASANFEKLGPPPAPTGLIFQ